MLPQPIVGNGARGHRYQLHKLVTALKSCHIPLITVVLITNFVSGYFIFSTVYPNSYDDGPCPNDVSFNSISNSDILVLFLPPPWPDAFISEVRCILFLNVLPPNLYGIGLPTDARSDDVSKFFEGYGRIIDCRVMTGPFHNNHRYTEIKICRQVSVL